MHHRLRLRLNCLNANVSGFTTDTVINGSNHSGRLLKHPGVFVLQLEADWFSTNFRKLVSKNIKVIPQTDGSTEIPM